MSESGASTARSLEETPRRDYIKSSVRKVSYEDTSERSKSDRSEDDEDDTRRSEDAQGSSENEEEEEDGEEEELKNVREDTDEDEEDFSSDHEVDYDSRMRDLSI